MNGLTPLIDLATQRSLDLFFRVGQGYVARTFDTRSPGYGLSPLGVQSRAHARIVSTLAPPSPDNRLHAWPVAGARPRPLLTMR